jgi:hypothetical protein
VTEAGVETVVVVVVEVVEEEQAVNPKMAINPTAASKRGNLIKILKFTYSAVITEKQKSPSIVLEGDYRQCTVFIPPPFPRRNWCTQRSGFPEKPGLQQAVLRRIHTGLAL